MSGLVSPAEQDLIRLAVEAAGLPSSGFSCTQLRQAAVNVTCLIRFADGERYIARIYRWPFEGRDDLDRPTKELWLSQVLRQHDIPAAQVLSQVETDDGVAVVRTFLPGEPLGDLPEIYDDAWWATGQSLARVHRIQIGDGRSGVISGREVRPFPEGSWGHWQLANAVAHSEEVAGRGEYDVDPVLVRRVYQRALPLFDERPVRLLHNDPHAWNVLVAKDGADWRCTGWLDWEFAWAGDPDWDLARLDIFRLRDIGPTPSSFYDGYGSGPVPVVSELYEFAIMLWMSNQAATGDRVLLPTYERAHRFLLHARSVLAKLEDKV